MNLQLQNFTALVGSAAAAVQGAASQLVDLTVGSTLRAVLEANAAMALWLQWLIVEVLQTTRAATSTGTDLDSWMADFTVSRLPAVAAYGAVTFSRFTPVSSALVPIGTVVRTADGTQSFLVTVDTGNAAYSVAQNGYVIAAGVASVTVPVVAQVAGSAGNVQMNAISLIAAALPGVDTVTNAAGFQGGLDAESDVALRSRFQGFLASRSQATTQAVGYAVISIQQGLQYTILENAASDGTVRMGNFIVIVDDGTGYPPPALLASTATAIEAVRPVGSSYAVQAPTVVSATISMAITTLPSAVHASVVAQVTSALIDFVNALPLGAPLPWSKLVQQAYDAASTVTNVSAVLLNGGSTDLTPTSSGVVKAVSVLVS
jgi:phage-related baseplate assembly protein